MRMIIIIIIIIIKIIIIITIVIIIIKIVLVFLYLSPVILHKFTFVLNATSWLQVSMASPLGAGEKS